MMAAKSMTVRTASAFTLVEVLVVLVIVAILAALAYPSYTEFSNRSVRSAGKAELSRIAQLQERYFMDNRTYATLSELGFAADTVGIDENSQEVTAGAGVYNLTITPAPTAAGFVAQATATGRQTADTGCTTLTVSATGQMTPGDCW